jgi:LysM repeat protein
MNMDKIGSNPDLIHTGGTIELPSDANAVASAGADASKYVVHSGDNLWNISEKTLGDHSRWGEIYKANSDIIGNNPRLILPGQELHIPGAESTSTIADASTPAVSQPTISAPPLAHAGQHLADASGIDLNHGSVHTAMAPHPTVQPSAPSTSISTVSHQPVLTGPGGATAANLDFSQAATGKSSLVSPNLAPDLSFFAQKR